MTISTQIRKVVGLGDGSNTAWPFSFLMPSADVVRVLYTDPLGNQTTITPALYTVSGIGNPNGGQVTYPLTGSAIPVGSTLTVYRLMPYTQLVNLINQGGYYPEVVEGAADTLEMQIQQLAELISRVLIFNIADINPDGELPAAAERAGKYLAFDGNGNPVTVPAVGPSSDLSAYTAIAFGGVTAISLARRFGWVKHIKDYGAVCDGVTDDTAAIIAAITAAPAVGSTLLYDGTPLISATITVNKPLRLVGLGASTPSTGAPSSYFLKKSTLHADAIVLNAAQVTMEGGGVVAQAGSTGANIQIRAIAATLRDVTSISVPGAGNYCFAIGDPILPGQDCDGWYMERCTGVGGLEGFHIDSFDRRASYGTAIACLANSNGSHGFSMGTQSFNTLQGCITANNGGFGIYVDPACQDLTIVGGRRHEAIGIALNAGSLRTKFYGIDTAEVLDNSNVPAPQSVDTVRGERFIAWRGTFTPSFAGSTTAGAQTYSTRQGRWQRNGDKVTFYVSMVMTAKDAATAGDLRITGLPFTLPASFTSLAGCAAIGGFGFIDLSAGYSQVGAGAEAGNAYFTLTESGDNVALQNLTAAALQATSRIILSGTFDVVAIP